MGVHDGVLAHLVDVVEHLARNEREVAEVDVGHAHLVRVGVGVGVRVRVRVRVGVSQLSP